MDLKTPISMLQEHFAKRGKVPEYVLSVTGEGTHKPLFIYHVSGFNKTAIGRGASKKEAKHDAATKLLSMLTSTVEPEDLQNPYTDSSKENTVGALQDFCLTYMINIPMYEDISSEGPPHSKIFITKCVLNTLSTKGEGRSKKQAKQIAAYQMLIKLKELLKEDRLDVAKPEEDPNSVKQSKAVERISEQLKKELVITHKKRVHVLIDDLDFWSPIFNTEKFHNSMNWKNLPTGINVINIFNPVQYFCQLMIELSIDWEKFLLITNPSYRGQVVCIQIKDLNKITFFGKGSTEDDAFRDSAISGLDWFAVMKM